MNILLDTNILIPLEDTGRELDPRLAELRRGVENLGYRLFIHPAQLEDINRDRNESRKAIVLSRLQQYNQIPSPPALSTADLAKYGWNEGSDNDRIDNLLLHALNRGAVHILVSEDEGVHCKASHTGIQDRVYRLGQILSFIAGQLQEPFRVPYGIRERYLHELDLHNTFFDSLRAGYGPAEFNAWYGKSSVQRRKCWGIADNTNIHALCIYKQESSPVVTDTKLQLNGNILKLCTLKVAESIRGKKIGERLLFTAFKYAVENQIDHIYIHTRTALHEHLISMVQDYGFQLLGHYGKDDVYSKPMKPPLGDTELAPLDYAIRYHPYFRNDLMVQKYLIPIQPRYHNDLFPDISDISESLFRDDPSFFNPQSNTIKKAYLCHANTKQIQPGDLLLFFRTHDRKTIEVIGVVEKAIITNDENMAASMVSKRTVFDKETLVRILKKPTLIILFRLVKYIPPIPHRQFCKAGIQEPVQTVRKISHETYSQLMRGALP